MSKQTYVLQNNSSHPTSKSNCWNNDLDYSTKELPLFWMEICEFVGNIAPGIFRAWIIETPNGKFTNEAKNKTYCSGLGDGLTLQQAKEVMQQKVKEFTGIDLEIILS